jgi:hypothetical protein
MLNSFIFVVFLILASTSFLIKRTLLSKLDKIILIGTYSALFIAITELDIRIRILAILVLVLIILFFESITGKRVRKQLGHPCKIGLDKVQYYISRDDLPLEDIIRIARKEIIFVSVSHEIVVPDKRHLIRGYS